MWNGAMDSFFMTDARRLAKDAPSMRLHDLIDWAEIAHKLKGLYNRSSTPNRASGYFDWIPV
jgi:IS5 family transposase